MVGKVSADDTHPDQGTAYAHCYTQGAAASVCYNAFKTAQGSGYRWNFTHCAAGGSPTNSYATLGELNNGSVIAMTSASEWASSGCTGNQNHGFNPANTCENRPDEQITVPSIADASGEMVPQIENPYCHNGCTSNISVGGQSTDCSFVDANTNGAADEGEEGGCPAFIYTDPAGVCSTAAAVPSAPDLTGSTPCTGTDCSAGGSGGGGGGGSGSGGSASPTPTPGGSTGEPGVAPIPGDDDSDGSCEAGEACAGDEGAGNDLLAGILGAIRGDGMSGGPGAGDYIGDGAGESDLIIQDVAATDTAEGVRNAMQSGVADMGDSLAPLFVGGGACPVFGGSVHRGWNVSIDSAEVGSGLRAIGTLILWGFVAMFLMVVTYRAVAGP